MSEPAGASHTGFSIPPELIQALRAARSITALTGAGISAESGIPTFRDSQTGLWANYDPRQLATPEAFAENPQRVLDWYRWRRSLINQAAPNPGHLALAALESRAPHFTLITQNIDGLHHLAGSQNIIELHGNIHQLCCSSSQDHGLHLWSDEALPRCPTCNSLLRPAVVWFGEALSPAILQRALQAAQHCDFFFSIGTSGIVEPAASLPFVALHAGATVVEVNPTSTPLTSYAHFHFPSPAGQFLPQLLQALD